MSMYGKIAGATLAVVSAMSLSSAAQAVTNTFDPAVGTGIYGNTVSADFSDMFFFTLPSQGFVSADINTRATLQNGSLQRDIDFTSVTLSGPGGMPVITFLPAPGSSDQNETRQLADVLLAAGTYTLTAMGTVTNGPASYSGNFNFTAVPETATWALMIGGVGMVGGSLRRRRVAANKLSLV